VDQDNTRAMLPSRKERTSTRCKGSQIILYLDDQVIVCCKERLGESSLSEGTNNPILLPTKHNFTGFRIS